ncbi:MAG: ABC transporter substrate-binding protein [Candidatus Kapabacteria bacterium]|nr:ABC transporter substrate-binding protein [Candidatus Kapabacteria bacterium]
MRTIKLLMTVVVAMMVVVGCNSCEKNNKAVIKIGAVIDITGSLSYMGKWTQEGALLAVEKINKNGGVNGKKIKLIIEDGGTDANKTLSAFQKLINNDNISIAIGFNSSSGLMASAPMNKFRYILDSEGGQNVCN